MKAVESGSIKKPGLSPEKAAEFTHGQSYSRLPARSGNKLAEKARNTKRK
jgi:hypothetical protein